MVLAPAGRVSWVVANYSGWTLRNIDVAERTVSRLMPKRRPQPSQTWRTFLANHVGDLVALDFFTVPTALLRVLFVLVVLVHHRRHVVHFNVTEHPHCPLDRPADRGRLPGRLRPSYLLRDRDSTVTCSGNA